MENELKCEIKGCNNTGAMLDHDGKNKCQEHLVESAFKKRPIKVVQFHRNDPCICGSGLKSKRCCLDKTNKLRQWLLQRIGRKIYYKNAPECNIQDCEDCKQWARGVKIQGHTHARQLDEYSKENKIQFTDIKPEL